MSAVCQQVTVLGSTGSIGVSTLDVISRHPDRYRVFALTGRRSVDRMLEQCRAVQPRYAVMADVDSAEQLRQQLASTHPDIEVLAGDEAVSQVAAHPEVDAVMAAIVGAAGLDPTLAAVRQGKRVLLANKESLVMAGQLFMDAVAQHKAQLLPIDSEHNAIFQCMPPGYEAGSGAPGVEKILLTASGGPFRSTPLEDLADVTPEQACAHPNWDMGNKISVDSATMMNKGLELIEACWLFNVPVEKVQVVIHPQSVIHSMVQYVDGSVLSQAGNPDMRTPISLGLSWPERIDAGVASLDLVAQARLDFEEPDLNRFPCLALAQQAVKAGSAAMTCLNAANEIAVDAFLNRSLRFTNIAVAVEKTIACLSVAEPRSLDEVKHVDRLSRELAREQVAMLAVKE
jgi:1-deoxy-D-xylulose-5-phosphate reductoisomerase